MAALGRTIGTGSRDSAAVARPLYTPDQRARRDASPWTLVQGILAPLQFLVFAVSFVLILRYLTTGRGEGVAVASVVVKTAALYAIMITGAAWEKAVFGRWLFAPPFFWEDAVSMGVIALHTLYLTLLVGHAAPVSVLMAVALAAYAAYVLNATQFVLKLHAARLQRPVEPPLLLEAAA